MDLRIRVLGATALLVGACGGPQPGDFVIVGEPINGVEPQAARYAIFDESESQIDVDSDGTAEDVTTVLVLVSDHEDLCGELADDPEAVATASDITYVTLNARLVRAAGLDGLVAGASLVSGSGNGPLDDRVSFQFTAVAGGVVQADIYGPAVVVDVTRFDGDALGFDFSGTLTDDYTDPTAVGTVDLALGGTGVEATRCAAF
ncbi:MAG: hypothetical protein H6709_16245 [Kofleriaceae bacterium]|nr:hypothetical protein [Myxococcales bacterium]MCB9563186.1 hypothetical protein [Kofleriaceae bacterium]MCB9573631.1 hypothetical protein [Kofleriaceae bacterium]